MHSLAISIFLYACELTTFSYSKECRPLRCYQTLLNISYKDHVTNEEVCKRIQAAIREYDELPTLVKKQTWWFCHI